MTDEPITRETITERIEDAVRVVSSRKGDYEKALADFAAGIKSQQAGKLDTLQVLALGTKVHEAEMAIAAAEALVKKAQGELVQVDYLERAGERARLLTPQRQEFKAVAPAYSFARVYRADDCTPEAIERAKGKVADAQVELALVESTAKVDWAALAALGADGVKYAVTMREEDGRQIPTTSVAGVAPGTRSEAKAPKATSGAGGGGGRFLFGHEQLGSKAYAEKYAAPESVARIAAAIADGKSASYSTLARSTAAKRNEPITQVS